MTSTMTTVEAQEHIHYFIENETPFEDMITFLKDAGFNKQEIRTLTQSVIEQNHNPQSEADSAEDFFNRILRIALSYGVPAFLIVMGLGYTGNVLANDLNIGIRVLAGFLLPLTIMFAMRRTDMSDAVSNILANNRLASFGIAFVFALAAAALAAYARTTDNLIPIGELAFSTTLGFIIFNNDDANGALNFLHIGIVTGFLSYIILFGIPS